MEQLTGSNAMKRFNKKPSREEAASTTNIEPKGSKLYEEDNRILHRKLLITGVVLFAMGLVSLCTVPSLKSFVSPLEVLSIYKLWFEQLMVSINDPTTVMEAPAIMALHPTYYMTLNQVAVTYITLVSGILLAVAGTLFQHVFRNPIASPTMLGVSGGIRLGLAIMVLLFGVAAEELINLRYLFTYGFIILTLVVIFVFGRMMSGKGRELNIINLLLVGTIVNQLIGVVITYITWYLFDDAQFETYNYISEAVTLDTNWFPCLLLTILAVIAIVPIIRLRFRLNVLSFVESDIKMLGVNPNRIRLTALICGTMMVIAAQINTGNVAMISLVVPFVSRFLYGAEFGKQLWGNMLVGAILLLFCRCILLMLPFSLTTVMGVGPVVNFIVLPVFVWMIATQQRSWT